MTSKAWADFLPEVRFEIGECLPLLAEHNIRNAAIEFCERSEVWIYEHDSQALVNGQSTYDFYPLDGAAVVMVREAWLDDGQLVASGPDALSDTYGNWMTETGTPIFFTQLDEKGIRLVPSPLDYTTLPTLRMTLALKPTRDATGVDEAIYQQWAEVIGYGAKARLQGMVGESWSNQAKAEDNARKFNNGIAIARAKVDKGFTRANLVAKQREFI